eukprot:TRINITY_DN21539_c0_g1_i1.p1 TRINITY_DN21539_c0_g1~~TRINITY_DN21539_c0_g1_i1.p1  ORF type:complete len:388 (-),score=68.84 TRINITY_DN21539_c0_g1_i1:41-1204(-)
MQTYVFLCTAIFCSVFLYGGLYPMGQVDGVPTLGVGGTLWCSGPTTYSTQWTSSLCGFQGFIFVQFSLAITYWWLVIIFNLYLSVVHDKRYGLERLEKYYHILAWGLPLLFNIIIFSIAIYSAGPPAGVCFVYQFNGGKSSDLEWAVYYMPLGIPLIIAMGFFIRILITIIYYSKLNKRDFIRPNLRVLIFIGCIIYLIILMFVFRGLLQNANIEEHVRDWAHCKTMQSLNMTLTSGASCPDMLPPIVPSYAAAFLVNLTSGGLGIMVFLIFGTDTSLYAFWRKLLIAIINRDKRQVIDIILHLQQQDTILYNNNNNKRSGGAGSSKGTTSSSLSPQSSSSSPRSPSERVGGGGKHPAAGGGVELTTTASSDIFYTHSSDDDGHSTT